MRRKGSIYTCFFLYLLLTISPSHASNFEYSEVGITIEHTQKKDYINQAESIGDTFDFNAIGLNGSLYLDSGYYFDTKVIGGYQNQKDTEYYLTDASIGLKKPIKLGSRIDIIPEIGFQHDLKGICSGDPCATTIERSLYLKLESRIWIIHNNFDARFSLKNANGFHRHETNMSLGYWRSDRQRIAIGYSNRSIGNGIRILLGHVF